MTSPTNSQESVLEFHHVALDRHKKHRTLNVLTDVTFTVNQGEHLALVGASGSGKSTILDLASGRLLATNGSVKLLGHELSTLGDTDRSLLRLNTVAYVHQDASLLPQYSALQNVSLPLTLRGIKQAQALENSREALRKVGLTNRLEHRPKELSGGERQRVAIARAIVTGPSLLLADEPTGALDAELRDEMVELLLNVGGDAAVLTVTHDPAVAARSDRTLRLDAGQILDA